MLSGKLHDGYSIWARVLAPNFECRSRRKSRTRCKDHTGLVPSVLKTYAKAQMNLIRMRSVLWLSMILSAVSLRAQPACPHPPAYEVLRQDEDYRYLRDNACKQDRWDFLKYARLGSRGDDFLTIGGELRPWYQGFRNADWG